ncbi:MAG: hypothetical protein PVH37_24195 [Desulfobacterales bacterium]|jgi:hypothetical protein
MKKIIITVFLLLVYAAIAFANAVEDRLPPGTSDKVKASTRQMILTGLKDDDVINMTRSMLENKFTIDNTLKAQQLIMKAHTEGLPLKPLKNKVFEGITKNVKPDRIVRAMEIVLSRYTFAYEQVAVLTKEKSQVGRLGTTLSAALAAGLENPDAVQICSMIQNRAQAMNSSAHDSLAFETLKTARDMARLSVASQAVADVLIQALQKDYHAEKMKSMRSSFMNHSRTGSPQNLAKSYSKAIQQGKSIDGLAGPAGMDHSGDLGGSGASSGSGGSSGSSGTGGSGGTGGGSGGSGGGPGGSGGGSGGSGGGSGGSGGNK